MSPSPVVTRLPALRVLALLVALLLLAAQPRAFAAGLPLLGSGSHVVANHAPHVGGHALRVEVALRVAPAPVLGRVPSLPPCLVVPRWLGRASSPVGAALAPAARGAPRGVSLGHFHSQRRIPRMNSDEPQRP